MVLLDEDLLCIVSAALWGMITIPTVLYCGYQLKANWHEQYMIKRRRSIITTIYFVFSAMLTTLVPVVIIPTMLSYPGAIDRDKWHQVQLKMWTLHISPTQRLGVTH